MLNASEAATPSIYAAAMTGEKAADASSALVLGASAISGSGI